MGLSSENSNFKTHSSLKVLWYVDLGYECKSKGLKSSEIQFAQNHKRYVDAGSSNSVYLDKFSTQPVYTNHNNRFKSNVIIFCPLVYRATQTIDNFSSLGKGQIPFIVSRLLKSTTNESKVFRYRFR